MTEAIQIALFNGKEIRKIIYKNEWWFSILDVITVLTDSPQAKTYWAKMKKREKEISQPFPFWEQLKLLGRSVVTKKNYLKNVEKKKLK